MLFLTFSLIIFPEESFHASKQGLQTWWEVVFPSLLPFFITAELLIRFGVVQFIGTLFEPIMRPLYNVPGVGSFGWMVGMASGYPAGAKIAVLLRSRGQLTQIEAERLVSFSNASSPLFIFGAIAVGFFHQPELGMLIALSHYIGNVFVGVCMRFYGKKQQKVKMQKPDTHIIHRAFQKMHRTRIEKKQPIGEIIGESVITSVQTLLMIGGFIILFSVFTSLLQITKITEIIHILLSPLLHVMQLPDEIIPAFFTGLFEITMGTEMITKLSTIPLITQLVIVSFILGFNGFSVQAQVASILAKSDIRFSPYFIARFFHAIFASIVCYVLFQLFFKNETTMDTSIPTFLNETNTSYSILLHLTELGPAITLGSIAIACIFLYSKVSQRHP
jgi:sporulation integral membrane protein YlbJ